MKRLIWKELVEQRYIPAAYALLLMTVLVVWNIMGAYVAAHGGDSTDRLNPQVAVMVLTFTLAGCGLIPGGIIISQEVRSGTIEFLSSLPVSRAKLWWSKVAGSLIILTASIFLVTVVFTLTVVCLFGSAGLAAIGSGELIHDLQSEGPFSIFMAIVYLFGVSILASTLTDRPIASIGLALAAGIALPAFSVLILSLIHVDNVSNLYCEICLYGVLAVYSAAYLVFRHGGQLRSGRKFIICGLVLLLFSIPGVITAAVVEVYTLRLSLMEQPSWTAAEQFADMPAHQLVAFRKGHKPRKISGLVWNIDFVRAKPGRNYDFELSVGSPGWYKSVPAQTLDGSPSVRSALETTLTYDHSQGGTKTVRDLWINLVYTPREGVGEDDQRVQLLSMDHKVIGNINIHARRATGWFPDDTRLPHSYGINLQAQVNDEAMKAINFRGPKGAALCPSGICSGSGHLD